MKKTELNKDHIENDYWKDNEHFADFYNTVIFNGKDILNAGKLFEKDTNVQELMMQDDSVGTIHRIKDVVKGYSDDTTLAVLGLENQTEVHYGMPLRVRIYNDIEYLNQCKNIVRKRNGKLEYVSRQIDTNDYVSLLKKNDRLQPVITTVIYYGERDWTGPVKFSDMLDVSEEFKEYFDDCGMVLVSAKDLKDYDFKNKDNKHLFSLIHDFYYNKDKDVSEILKPYVDECISRSTILLVGVVVRADELLRYALQKKEKTIDMCEAVQRWEQKITQKGRMEGEAHKTYIFIKNILESTGKCLEEACDLVGITTEEYEKAKAIEMSGKL